MAYELTPLASVPLAGRCTLGVGGAAQWFADVTTAAQVGEACRWAADRALPLTVLGGGSNVVISEHGVPGLVVRMAIPGCTLTPEGRTLRVTAGAGESWDGLVETTVGLGAWGLECLSGIPGTVGGTPVQNVGAYGQDVSQTIEAVTVVDRQTGVARVMAAAECGFGYRASRFRSVDANRYIIADVTFALSSEPAPAVTPEIVRVLGDVTPDTPRLVREAVLTLRRAKGMVVEAGNPDARSVGSFFMNPVLPVAQADTLAERAAGQGPPMFPAGPGRVKVPAAWLIEQAGWTRGSGAGPAGLSSRHALAIVNRGGASAEDVVTCAVRVKRAVLDRFGVALVAEPIFLGFDEDARVAFLKGTTD